MAAMHPIEITDADRLGCIGGMGNTVMERGEGVHAPQ